MWDESRVRAALAKKQERLEEAERQLDITKKFLFAEAFMNEPQGAVAIAGELYDQQKRVEKIKNQIEVLNYILDN